MQLAYALNACLIFVILVLNWHTIMKENSNIVKCEICLKDATCLCYKCMSYFCDNCFNFVHKIEERKTHKKEKIDYFVPVDIKCPEYNLVPMNLFCLDEKGN